MTQNRVRIDISFLYILYQDSDSFHNRAQDFAKSDNSVFIIPDVVMTETAFLFNRSGGIPAVARFLITLAYSQPNFEPLTETVVRRASEIMLTYNTANFDFVDCCIMALAERLGVTRVCTFDRRDFAIFRPQHCDYLELLP